MKLPVIAPDINERMCEASACEACGQSFACGATLKGCWCTEVELSDEVRTHLRKLYTACLCRACLEEFARSERDLETIGQDALTTSHLEKNFGTPQ